jgi:hypothetical protein
MKNVGMFSLVIAVLLFTYTAHANIWYVHPDSTLNSIQAGIGLCSTGDTVLVGPGIYIENINFNSMAITVTSEYGPDTTIVDGSSPSNPDTGSVVCFVSGEDTTSVLQGFTIKNGSGTYDPIWAVYLGGGIYCHGASPIVMGNVITDNNCDYGGGIECEYSSSPIIADNNIVNDSAELSAGGIDCYYNSSPHIEGNTIDSNYAGSGGGGIQCYTNCSPEIIGNTFVGNYAGSWGGGIRCGDLSSPFIRENLINGNTAVTEGGGIECDANSHPTIRFNTITGNSANHGGGVQCDLNASPIIDSCAISDNLIGGGIWCEQGSNPTVYHNNITDNEGYAVRNIDPGYTIAAENNWWGHSTGPYHPTANPGALGDTVSDYVNFVPWDTVAYPWGIEEHGPREPIVIALQVSPNPFRDKVSITFSKEYNAERTAFTIYDATGRVVREFNYLVDNCIDWNGIDDSNRRLPSGVYFLKLTAGDYSASEKLLLIR